MDFTRITAFGRLQGSGAPVRAGSEGGLTVGMPAQSFACPTGSKVFSRRLQLCSGTVTVNMLTGAVTPSVSYVAAVAQVERIVVVGTVTLAGTVKVTVLAPYINASPVEYFVPVLLADTKSQVAAKIVAYMNPRTADFTWAVTELMGTTTLHITRVLPDVMGVINDTGLNIKMENGTATGMTNVTTSTNAVAGSQATGTYAPDGHISGDAEGLTMTADTCAAFSIVANFGIVSYIDSGSLFKGKISVWVLLPMTGGDITEMTFSRSSSNLVDFTVSSCAVTD